ncbi:DPP IV N-terminal domain-containing protein (plasmid) [Novosphingobium resinovorum]|uniref:S9 family peptidase n=1 Tax=Novosphingobium TaxID=165696 RepID=UPI001B3C5187|nr:MULTISPECIES: DPP IV N-terminal domain-containing protein [Novosphingobium]MBF7015279.1 S9 family peptidase [Novosphingobium sp. HR1a]WJM29955.1 DPP IV N-terminal domain-containing protein [Novosphingobium resinovorum]
MSDISWTDRYAYAQAALLAADLVTNGAVFPTWIDETHFWYLRKDENGGQFRVFDAAAVKEVLVIAVSDLAAAIGGLLGTEVDPGDVVIGNPVFDLEAGTLRFAAYGQPCSWDWAAGTLDKVEKTADLLWLASPDGAQALTVDGCNLAVRDLASGETRALTTDGVDDNAYGLPPLASRGLAAVSGGAIPEALWSPDSKWVLTVQTDERHVPGFPLADYAPVDGVRPAVRENRTSLPGDPKVTEYRMLAIEVASGRQVEARYPRVNAVRMNTTPFAARLAWWSADSRIAYFVDIERGEAKAHVVAFDVATGATRVVFSEESDTYVEVSVTVYTPALIAPLPETNELIWYSERSGRGHLYLYDLVTGAMRHPITHGDWQVLDILTVDAANRRVFLTAGNLCDDATPYLAKPCVASIDGDELRALSSEPGEHRVWRPDEMALLLKKLEGLNPANISGISPSSAFFVETVSDIDRLPVTYLRRADGSELCVLERATSLLPETWTAPERVRCKAADGVTDVYGIVFKPLGYDPTQRYPVIDLIYGGPQTSYVPRGHPGDGDIMSTGTYSDAAQLASLGAFVVVLDGRGTAQREQAFRTASHRAAHTASNLEDHVAAIRELAQSRPQMDLDRVGLTGFSAGGYMTAHGALRFGEFFKVCVAGGGNYDQALFWHTWGERYHGAFEAEHYAAQAAKTYASGLQGKLLLVHGLLDSGCHPAALFQLTQALTEQDKDFDLVILPRAGHDWTGYGTRRRWAYFAEHLMGAIPPKAKSFTLPLERIFERAGKNSAPPAAVE